MRFTDEALLAPVGKIVMTFNGIPTDCQRTYAEAFSALLDQNTNPLRLNVGSNLLSALVNFPDSSKVLVLYGVGFGLAVIGSESAIANKYLALSGDGSASLGPQLCPSCRQPSRLLQISSPKRL